MAFLPLVARMAPGILFLLPWFVAASALGLTDNYLTLILTHAVITLPLVLWLMLGYFEDMPPDVEESALIDGASWYRVLVQVAVPLALPGLAVSAVLAFIFSWNYFLFALVLSGFQTMPLTVAAFNFIGQASIDYGGLMAAATVISLPPLILLLFVQTSLVKGLTAGAVKG
ncbi:MAG: carbohydrate ABC transporter permease [Chloroflexota bacterium]